MAYLEVDKIEYLITLIWSRHVNRLSGQARLLNRSGQTKKIGLWQAIGQAQACKKFRRPGSGLPEPSLAWLIPITTSMPLNVGEKMRTYSHPYLYAIKRGRENENRIIKKRLNYTFGPRILTSSRKWSCLFQIEQNRPKLSCFFAVLVLSHIFNSRNAEKW